MTSNKRALCGLYPRHIEVPALIVTSAVTLWFGLTMPVIVFEQLVFWKDAFSVLGGIQNLIREKQLVLAGVIFLFSAIFPVVKLTALSFLWFLRLADAQRLKALEWVERMGKWSMVDVFVLAIVIVLTKATPLTKAEPRAGLYVFSLSVILSMATAMRIGSLAKQHTGHKTAPGA